VEVEMPWFPDFVAAVELARIESRASGQADPVGLYLAALQGGDPRALETVWPGDVVVFDPRAGEVRGHDELLTFVRRNTGWLADLQANAETVASMRAGNRAVVELLAQLLSDGQTLVWPVAVVAEAPNARSVIFRSYCSQWPLTGRRPVRSRILPATAMPLSDVVAEYFAALAAGDAERASACFAPDGYLREPIGPHATHRGSAALREHLSRQLTHGGIDLQVGAVTDDGRICAVEYTCVRWGAHALPPQGGLGVYERGDGGLLAAARLYDDIEPPSA
jgi:ketosteroid isomerase-like protein